jgi:hypothetical protein
MRRGYTGSEFRTAGGGAVRYLNVPHVGVDGVHNGGQNVEVEVWGAASLGSEGGHMFI